MGQLTHLSTCHEAKNELQRCVSVSRGESDYPLRTTEKQLFTEAKLKRLAAFIGDLEGETTRP
ncbi:MAG: hypothetical protein EBR81_12335 [Proteobacteria bacterium]|nr:hypothetical protein [Pseudomonadota bacterium]